jgi:hypothetical protein
MGAFARKRDESLKEDLKDAEDLPSIFEKSWFTTVMVLLRHGPHPRQSIVKWV